MTFINLLESLGFCNVDSDQFTFRDKIFNYTKANQAMSDIQYSIIANLFLVELTEDNVNLFQAKDAYEAFCDFQNKLLSDTFFEYKSDLRWNIYLLFIAESPNVFINLPVNYFESDDNYARKFFLTTEEAQDFISRNNYIKSEINNDFNAKNLPNPLTDWISTLQSVDLTGTIGEFKSYYVKDYIYYSKSFNVDTMNLDIKNDITRSQGSELCKKIAEVDVKNFRRHCFNNIKKIETASVNLIHGSNGCGKTSILEGIEYAMTSEIKHTKDFKGTYDNQSASVRLYMSDGSIETIDSSKSKDICKTYDNNWYGAPITKGNGLCTLNSNFNHFNNFNSETIYNFALEESVEDKNYKYLDKFSRLIFSNDLIKFQKNWMRYKDEFLNESSSLSKSIEKKEVEIANIKSDISTAENTLSNHSISNGVINSELKYKRQLGNSLSVEDTITEAENIYQILKAIETVTQELDTDLTHLNLFTLNSVTSEKAGLNVKLQNTKSIYGENTKIKTDKEREIITNTEFIHKMEQEQKALEIRLANIEDALNTWEKCKLVILNPTVIDEINKLTNESLVIEKKSQLITTIKAKYPNISTIEINKFIPIQNYDINNLNKSLIEKASELGDLEDEIKIVEEGMSKLKQLKVSLNNVASDILKISEQKNVCPLCGEKYENNAELINSIRLSVDLSTKDETLLDKLMSKKNIIQNEISNIKDKIAIINERNDILCQLKEIFLLINESKLFGLTENEKIEILYSDIIKVLNYLENLKSEMNRIKDVLSAYEQSGYNNKSLKEAKLFKDTNQIFIKYITENKDSKVFDEYLNSHISEIKMKINKNKESIQQISVQIDTLKNQISLLNIEPLNNEINDLNSVLNQYKKVEDNYKVLNEYFDLGINDNLADWISSFRKAIVDLDIRINTLKLTQAYKLKKTELAGLETELTTMVKHFERCSNACKMFKQMKELKDYSHTFIQENRKRIERFFKLLHTPREFKSLELSDDGIIAIRGKDNKVARMHEMSTGQRTSFAISLILSLYISARNAPKFLIFDEPVANLDDLHLLNLLDILRDFALSGTQIFFTTANPEVAGMFRRKFSFFGSEFKHFELSRINDGYTDIKIVKYVPDIEMGEILAS